MCNDNLPPSSSDDAARFNRRKFIGSSALVMAALAATRAGAQDLEKISSARQDGSASDPGPENDAIRATNPDGYLPPPTDHGEAPEFWNSFSAAHRHIQPGGWSREVTAGSFPISQDMAGVNMRLTAGGIRELHWHMAAEWAIMLSGKARITVLDLEGRGFVKDVVENDLWFFPPGVPHSIQGLEPDGCEFLLVFDSGTFSEGNTSLISDWVRHVPREVLAKNWGVPESALDALYTLPQDGLFIFQEKPPGPLEDDQKAIAGPKGLSPVAFDFPMHSMAPTRANKSGEARIVDSRNFPVTTMAAAQVVVKPGGMRELHWHPNGDEWQYYQKGQGRMTVFFTSATARTADFRAGDVGFVPRTFGHYVENTGDTDLVFLEIFKADRFEEFSLSNWIAHTPPQLVMEHLRIDEDTLKAIAKNKAFVVPV